ncbi:hypothetical protein AMAG_17072 [Allomyces macrogynus ATCC 38327]|uniref:DUF866 domain-containing protein n=1 Tax=Allomyces macrogynus (strain ATCC 38327) TaxID=578462 RepID=A0A0L0TDD6_ALLM3|nr:hypothetical protein AMAG_17072 [Allomyces macrogynus ATCC 38327]|eukprot:KNE72742.1 hypothetical protein AMAG_17072 [Allomyces macrogynus ATCC 38327]
MVFLGLALTADLEHVASAILSKDADVHVTVQCSSCRETHPTIVTVSPSTTMPMSGSRGDANLVMKCKFCRREGSISYVDTFTAPDAPFSTPKVECRGLDITAWHPRAGWTVTASESATVWTDVDLSEDWFEYDDKAGVPVSIAELQPTVTRL